MNLTYFKQYTHLHILYAW